MSSKLQHLFCEYLVSFVIYPNSLLRCYNDVIIRCMSSQLNTPAHLSLPNALPWHLIWTLDKYNAGFKWVLRLHYLNSTYTPKNLLFGSTDYSDVIIGDMMASQITSLTIVYQPFIKAQIKENTKAPRHLPLCGEFTGHSWIPRTNGQSSGKCSIWRRHHDQRCAHSFQYQRHICRDFVTFIEAVTW